MYLLDLRKKITLFDKISWDLHRFSKILFFRPSIASPDPGSPVSGVTNKSYSGDEDEETHIEVSLSPDGVPPQLPVVVENKEKKSTGTIIQSVTSLWLLGLLNNVKSYKNIFPLLI
jgi:hypothetical protein